MQFQGLVNPSTPIKGTKKNGPTSMGVDPAGMMPAGQPIYVMTLGQSKAAEFDKGRWRLVLDYTMFSNHKGWPKWQRSLIGTTFDHKCKKVLNPTYCPDPCYSCATKVSTEDEFGWRAYCDKDSTIQHPQASWISKLTMAQRVPFCEGALPQTKPCLGWMIGLSLRKHFLKK